MISSMGTRPSFLLQPWPDDLPATCPTCGHEFENRLNLKIGRGKVGRALRTLSYWFTVPWGIICLIGIIFFGWIPPGMAAGYAFVTFFMLPSVTFAIASACSPITRRVRCWQCGFDHDYSRRKRTSLQG